MSIGIEALTGYSVNQIVSNNEFSFASLIHPEDAAAAECDVLLALKTHSSWSLEYRLRRRDGNYTWVTEQGIGNYDDDGQIQFLDGFMADISERKGIEDALQRSGKRIRELAFYDSLTGLPNRNLFLDSISSHLENSGEHIALLYIDLDGFKAVNDTYGHTAGDETLAIVGSRLQQVVADNELVARIGGDEFIVLCKCDVSVNYCLQLAQNIVREVSRPLILQDNSVQLGASIGISFSNTDGFGMHSLISAADQAMFSAKRTGSNLIEVSGGAEGSKAA